MDHLVKREYGPSSFRNSRSWDTNLSFTQAPTSTQGEITIGSTCFFFWTVKRVSKDPKRASLIHRRHNYREAPQQKRKDIGSTCEDEHELSLANASRVRNDLIN
jgi:hypothetical protein